MQWLRANAERRRQPRLARALAALLALGATGAVFAQEPTWREVEPERLVFLELQEGRVTIELNPDFAPKTVQQFRRLVQEGFYDGLPFYRVIDGFVAQAGDGSDLGELSEVPLIEAEFDRAWSADFAWTSAQRPDFYAPETGYVDGFAVARDPAADKAWLPHCPGVVAMARNEAAGSSRTDFYIVIGQAPRYLDRNMNVFGRVIDGMDVVQRIRRGPPGSDGVIRDDNAASRIGGIRLADDLPKERRPSAYVVDTASEGFRALLEARRQREQRFFHNRPPAVLDVCQVPVAGRITK